MILARQLRQLQNSGMFHVQQFIVTSINWRTRKMKNKEKCLTNFSEAKRKKATQKYNIIKHFILGEQSLSSISKSKGIALSTIYRWNKSYKEQGLKGLIYATRADKGTRKIEPMIIDEIERPALMNKRNSIATIHRKITNYCKENNFDIPSYKQIYSVIKAMQIGRAH